MWAILPVKDMTNAKTRLSDVLYQNERHDFFHAMLTDVLGAVCATPLLEGVAIITKDKEAQELARHHNIDFILENENNGQTTAVSRAISWLKTKNITTVMQIPGDIPLTTPTELISVIESHRLAPSMSIVPARDKRGSNCVICSPPDVIKLNFGNNSFIPHLHAAKQAGIRPTISSLPGIGLDIDTPDDLKAFLQKPSDTHSYKFLVKSGIAKRCQAINSGTTSSVGESI